MNHKERRDQEMAYIADASVFEEMKVTKKLVQQFNQTDCLNDEKLDQLLQQIIGKMGKNCLINQPFFCDYGSHITVGDNFFANYGCTILDVGKVTIGDNVFFAPNVSVYTAGHPLHPVSRNCMYEYGIAITIGNNVWVGGSVVICPGVTIGNNVVIGAGSVVTKDIPEDVIAAGNPCRVIRKITEEDMQYYYKDRIFDKEAWDEILQSNK